jgi:hypothetical protein
MLVAGSDRTINPDLERWYAKRANSHVVEVAGASHAVLRFQAETGGSADRRGCLAGSVTGKKTTCHAN